MAHNGQMIGMGEILWRVLRQPLLKDLKYEEAAEYALECIPLLGAPMALVEKVTDPIPIESFKSPLPCSLVQIRGVRYLGLDGCQDPIAMREATNLYHRSQNELNNEHELVREYTYSIQNGIIFTSREEGFIEISYRAIATDENEFPLIPNTEKVKLALEYYIMFRYLEQLFSVGKITDKVFQYYEQKKCWYMGAANTDLQMPTIDKMESMMNAINRLIINDKAHESFYKNFGMKEYIKDNR